MPVAVPTAVDQLDPSKLVSPVQMELLGGDVDLVAFNTQMHGIGGLQLVSAITDAVVDRTIEGASTLTVSLDDDERTIGTSGRLGRHVDVNVDGLWWTLVAVKKTSRQLQLVFEEREVNVLRYYDSFIYSSRNDMTRAQFVLRMIKEVKELDLQWVIPELHIKQPILGNVPGPGQILVDQTGAPLTGSTDPKLDAVIRQKGIAQHTGLTVKGESANREQINAGEIILQTGQLEGAGYKVMVCSIMVAITESTIHNYLGDVVGGHMENVGVFQQDSRYWPATRDVSTDAREFIRRCMDENQKNPNLTYAQLCQAVQHSGAGAGDNNAGANYAPYQTEAEKWVADYSGQSTSGLPLSGTSSAASAGGGDQNFYTRGTIQQAGTAYLLTKENSWNCMQRLAGEVKWRSFCVSGIIYFISEEWLFTSKPFMVISEDSVGIDWIDYDFDEGKKVGTCTITAHLSRWAAPPGSIVRIQDMGVVDGNWLVNDVTRSIYDTIATITLKKPDPKLPEPVSISGVPKGFDPTKATTPTETPVAQGNAIQKTVVAYATKQLGLPYKYGAEVPGIAFDCSGLTQAAYSAAGVTIPRVAQDQYNFGKQLPSGGVLQPGDLVFFGSDATNISHVGIYIGNGNMIDAPETGAFVRVDSNWRPKYGLDDFIGATRPWQA